MSLGSLGSLLAALPHTPEIQEPEEAVKLQAPSLVIPRSPLPVAGVAAMFRSQAPRGPVNPSAGSGGRTGRVAYVGDSLGVGTSPFVGADRTNVEVGRSSLSGVQALEQIFRRRGRFDTVIFDLGTNDPGVGALRRSLRRARALAGPDTTFIIPTVNGPHAERKNEFIRGLAGGNIRVVDWARHGKGLVGPDGIHAGPQGYRQRAKWIREQLG